MKFDAYALFYSTDHSIMVITGKSYLQMVIIKIIIISMNTSSIHPNMKMLIIIIIVD